MNVGGSIYILKGNFSLKLEKVLDPPFNDDPNPIHTRAERVSGRVWLDVCD